MIAMPLALIVAAMLLVRIGWEGRRDIAAAGWALAIAALLLLGRMAGAWGVALGVVVGSAVAIGFVLHAGWTAPARTRRAPREAPSVTIPHEGAELARRVAVFVLVVPVAFAAAQWLAYGAQAIARRGGAGDADATMLTLFLQPILWGCLMAWQMMRPSPTRMIAAPAGAALLGTILWGLA